MTPTATIASSLLLFTSVSGFQFYQHKNVAATRLQSSANSELHLLTFDLDDTIFPIDPVIQDANSMMIQTLNEFGYDANNDEIIKASKRIRQEVRERGEEITYSDLRKQSIRSEMERLKSSEVDDKTIDKVFNSWLDERHASADRNLFQHTELSLQRIRQQYPTVVIGAITNGRGNPLHMPSIAEYFDFCVSGEDDNVFPLRKPDKGIYQAALRRFDEFKTIDEVNWVHVGDDLANDVGASAACGAKTVWLTSVSGEDKGDGFWSTATPEEMQRRQEMDQVAKQFVDAEINALDGLVDAIQDILQNK